MNLQIHRIKSLCDNKLADVIMFIYRDEVYNKDTTKKGIAEIILSKQRNGPTGIMDVAWMRECTKFIPMEQCTNNIGNIK